MVFVSVIGLAWWSADGPVRALEAPELRPAPEPFEAASAGVRMDEGASQEANPGASADERIGDFRRPEAVPNYEILDERRNQRDGARGAWVMVDTRSHSQEEYVLITRHLKARYADLDAVSVEFIDLTETLRYNGGALIFNTPAGADYIGYVYGPPNNEGYYVQAAE